MFTEHPELLSLFPKFKSAFPEEKITSREQFRENIDVQEFATAVVAGIGQIINEIENASRCIELVKFIVEKHNHLKGFDAKGAFFQVSFKFHNEKNYY